MSITLTLFIALLLDFLLGEPKKWHPLVGFGHWANQLEAFFNHTQHSAKQQTLQGICAVLLAIIPILIGATILTQSLPYLEPIILYLCIAPKSLLQHTLAVYRPLVAGDLMQARQAISMIVSRETQEMQATDIRKATIETTLENGADAVFSPIFWFLIAGPIGVIFYRLSNTLDAMWGYKNPRYLHFGYAAAKLDDLLNWLPARLTALSYALLSHFQSAWQCCHDQSPHCESPNAGIVMSAGAGGLQIQLGGAAIYHGKLKQKPILGQGRTANNNDIKRANLLILLSLGLWFMLVFLGETLA